MSINSDFEINEQYIKELQSFQSEKKNLLILSNQKIKDYIKNLAFYFKITPTNEQVINFELQLKTLLLNQWGFYPDSSGIRTKENIQTVNIYLDLIDLKNLASSIGIHTLRSYFFFGLLNAVVETTKTFFGLDYTDSQLIIRTNESIEKSEFGMYMYMMYIVDKYKKSLCIATPPFENLLQLTLSIHNSFTSKTKLSDQLAEIKKYYQYSTLNLLNPNLYVFILFTFSVMEAIKKSEITYDYDKDKFTVSNDLKVAFESCNKRFIMIPLTLEFKDEETIHQNIILIDRNEMKAERFEPHGIDDKTLKRDKQLNQHLTQWLKQNGITYSQNSYMGVQYFESFLPDFLRGKCLTLSFDYLKYRIEDLLEQEIAPAKYFTYVKDRGLIHWKDICEKNDLIFDQLQVYLDILNQTFKTTLKFQGTTLVF
jgi:hypothetical protein